MSGAYAITPAGIMLRLRVTPNAGRDVIVGLERRDDGTEVLAVRVKAVPEGGKANQAVIAILARALGVARRDIGLVAGDTARLKTLAIAGDGAALARQLTAVLAKTA